MPFVFASHTHAVRSALVTRICAQAVSFLCLCLPSVFFLGLARTIYIYGVYTVYLAGKSPYIRSYTVEICSCGQTLLFCSLSPVWSTSLAL